ncbi:DUF6862 domain-containing protein [Ruegeria halocynthiae]|uniref:two-partner secretion domain-containing protein n=1 Tax=Ruegeria halocynthiae TaxID=985054 RepID=UPI0005659BBF|nr:filamentous hemagglutinin N-terminal domain-containing protein [Ruegeria halocynthiae]
MRRRVFEKVISSVLTLALTIQPALLHAQNIQPVNPSTGPRPHVDQSLNGTTVVNISTPNGAGVSHDVYTDFQANDLILNNSATITNTQLGGVIEGNGNLAPGQEANLWIGEVVGGNQTQLNGILEVAGKRMDVVVANEFGITCDGCGFINTGRATLTTGKPQFGSNGALTGFDVRRGTVTIGPGGLNPENRIGLTDTSRVDVIARAAAIYGKMRADQLNIVAGANQVDYNWSYDAETGAVTGITEQAGEGAAPALAVDVAALGGMYANAIRLIATENGVGVRLNGDMASSTNIALRADGQLTLGAPSNGHTPQIRAGGRVQVRNQGPILLEGAITSESGDLIDIRTSNGDLIFNGQAAGGAIRLESAGMLNISGAIVAREAFEAASTGASVVLDNNSEVFARSIDVDALTQLTFDGKAAALETASLTAGTELVTGTSSELVAESAALTGGDARIEGQVQTLENLTIEATDGSVDHRGTSRGQAVTITGDDVQTSDGSQIAAVGDLSVTAADQAKISGELVAGKGLTLKSTAAGIAVETNAEILAESLNVKAQTRIDFDGKAAALETASVSAGTEVSTGTDSELLADSVALTGETAQLSGEIRAIDGLTIEATDGAVEHSGVSRGQNVSIIGDTVETGDTSQIAAVDGLTVTATDQILLGGELASGAELAITSTGASVTIEDGAELVADTLDVDAQTQVALNGRAAVQNQATLTAGAELVIGDASELVAGSINLSGAAAQIGGQAEAQNGISIEARDGTLEHSGRSRGQSVTLSADRVQTGDSSQIAAIADVQVTATDQAIIDGNLIAGQQADISVTVGDLDLQGQINARNTNVSVSGQTTLGADATAVGQSILELQSGSLSGGLNASHFDQLRAGDGLAVTLATGGLSVGASERVELDGDLLLDLGGDLENRGTIKASGDLQLRSGSDLNNRGGLLKSGEVMQLVARDGTVLNQSGRIEADGGLAVEAEVFVNSFDSVTIQPSTSGVEVFAGNPTEKTRSRTIFVDPADLELDSCTAKIPFNSYSSSNCATIYNFGISDQSNVGGVTWSSGTSVVTTGAQPEVLSGAGIAIQANVVRNNAGMISSAAGMEIRSNRFENRAYEDDRVTHTATYTRQIEKIDPGTSDARRRAFEHIIYSPVKRIASNGANSVSGEILAGGGININGTTVHADGNIKAGTTSAVSPGESAIVTNTPLPELVVPANALAPVQPDVLNLPALEPVQPEVKNQPPLEPVLPELQKLANLDVLIGEGRTNFGTTPVSYEDLLSSDYFLDRLQIQNELFQNINRPTEWNGYQSDGVNFAGGSTVQIPDSEFIGFGDRFGLSESGVLASLNKANASESGDLKITAGSITGSGGSLIAEGGSLSLTSFGNIDFEDTELGGDLVKIITGGDFSGKALVIKSASDTSIFAAGNVTIEGLAQTEEYYTGTSVTKITENLASRFEVGGNLSIISTVDTTLAGVQAQVTGDTRLTAGGNLYLLAEQSGVQYNAGNKSNGTDRLTLTAQVTQLSTGGDFIANAGGDAVLVGTQINAGGRAHLAAAGDVVLAAAQDIAKSETRKTSSGFLSKKKETRSTLAVTNRGVAITAGGDIDVIAETGDLTTAGTEFASASGDINLTATEGNILVGTYTDVFEVTHIKEKSYLGGLLSKSSQLHTVDHINTGTDALAALDLSIVSGTDTTLVGATLSAGQNLNITTGGDFSVQAAIDSHRSEFFETDMGLVVMTTITETSSTETAQLTELLAGQGMNFDIGGNAELVVYQTAGVDAPNPQDLYPEELLAIDGLELISQELADEYFYEEKTQLSPAFKALVSIVVAAYVAPALVGELLPQLATAASAQSATALTTGLYNGATAFTSTALVETLDGVVAGDIDLGAILEAATFSGVSAGLTSGINLNIPESSPLNDALISGFGNPQGPQLTVAGILEGALDGSISSGLSSAVYGTDFSDGFSASLVQTVTNLALADAQFEIGGLFTDANGNAINGGEGSAGHMLLHALAGCAAAEATGAECAAGAAGGIAQSIFVGTDPALVGLSDYEIQKRAELFGAVAGLLASGGNAENVVAAAAVAQSAALNNYLSHTEAALRSDLVDKLLSEECQSGGCEEDLSKLRELNELDLQRDADFAAACGAGSASSECRNELTKLQDAFESYEGAYRSREVLADGTLGEYLDVASKFGTYRSEAMSKAAREALIEMPVDSAKGVIDLVEISALALTGDETAQQQLKLVASQTWDLIKDPIGTTQNQIKADLEKADRLEAQGKIQEANKLRSKVFISGYLSVAGVAGAASATSGGIKVVLRGSDPEHIGSRIENRYDPINEGPLPTDIAKTFRSATYNEVITTEPTKLYRVISDNGNPAGGYWTRTKPEGPLQSVIDSALDQNWGNTATRVVEMEVPAGTRLFEGFAAPQRDLVGGGNQVYFDRDVNPLNPDWISQ